MTKIGITGSMGRMGQLLVAEAQNDPALTFAGGVDKNSSPQEIENLFDASDVMIDFSAPIASINHAQLAAKHHKALLIGTTGLDDTQIAELKDYAQSAPILLSANTSLGVNLLIQMTKKIATILDQEYAVEILESHHRHKVDAPSGTALALGRAVASGRNIDFDDNAILSRQGHTGPRNANEIGFSVIRGGDIVGEHTVYFIAGDERLELTHRATDRKLFARGAIQTALWLAQQKNGFYTMEDFLKF